MDESVVKHLERQAAITKLSQAIRVGAKLRPKCRVGYFAFGGSCALGAAWEAMGKRGAPPRYFRIMAESMGFDIPDSILEEVIDMNDERDFSREEIANWLEARGY